MILLPLPHSIQGLVGTSYIFVLLTSVANFHEIKCHENAMKSLVLAKKTIKSRSNTMFPCFSYHFLITMDIQKNHQIMEYVCNTNTYLTKKCWFHCNPIKSAVHQYHSVVHKSLQ